MYFSGAMRLLRRYLLRQLLAPFVFGLGALTSMVMMNQIAKRLGDLVGKGLEWTVIGEFLLLSLPFIVALTLPMAVLVAVLYAFAHLTADSEITAMRASGVSVGQILRPVFLVGIVVALGAFFFLDQVLPRSNARLRNLQLDISLKKPTFTLREQVINPVPPSSYWLRSSHIDAGTGRLTEVTIYDLGTPNLRRVIVADSGRMAFDEGGHNLSVTLYRGRAHEYQSGDPATLQTTTFEQNTILVRNVENTLELGSSSTARGDREMTTCEMIDQVRVGHRAALTAAESRSELVRRDLLALLRLAEVQPSPVQARGAPGPSCGVWRKVERFFGRIFLPTSAEAQVQGPTVALPGEVPAGTPSQADSQATAAVILSSLTELTTAQEAYRHEIRMADAFAVEVHKKFSIAFACLNFVLIGIALALRFPRGGVGLVIGASLLIFALFYIGLTAGEGLADRGIITPWLAMWLPNLFIMILGMWGLVVANRHTGTTRGGDMADLKDSIRNLLRFRRRPS